LKHEIKRIRSYARSRSTRRNGRGKKKSVTGGRGTKWKEEVSPRMAPSRSPSGLNCRGEEGGGTDREKKNGGEEKDEQCRFRGRVDWLVRDPRERSLENQNRGISTDESLRGAKAVRGGKNMLTEDRAVGLLGGGGGGWWGGGGGGGWWERCGVCWGVSGLVGWFSWGGV